MIKKSINIAVASGLLIVNGMTIAGPLTMDISYLIRSLGVEEELTRQIPGSDSVAILDSATLTSNGDSNVLGPINVAFRLHVKDRSCMWRPFGGKWCFDSYNFWTTMGVKFNIGSSCNVQDVDVYKHSSSHNIDAGVFHELIYKRGLEGKLTRMAESELKDAIKNIDNPIVQSICKN